VLDHICCRHLYGQDRMLIAWRTKDQAVVLAVGPHDRSVNDVYGLLLAALRLDLADAGTYKTALLRRGWRAAG
jgi:hypothetical protein